MIPRTVLVAPDAFKGTLSSSDVAAAVGAGLEDAGLPDPDLCPIADGGEGTLDVLLDALGGELRQADASDPLGRPLRARFGLAHDGAVAIVEVAEASGLARVAEAERDAERATTRGTGELICAAVRAGAQQILVAAGGSATSDGGAGAIEAIRECGGLGSARIVVLCDVRTPFEQAAARFGPQKGADAAAVRRLRARLNRLATRLPRDPRGQQLTGAAGGLSGGLWAVFGAHLTPGAPYILDALGFDARLAGARAVVVGEGRLDHSTLEGKAAFEVATRARQMGVPAHAVTGENALDRFDARIMDLQVILEAGDRRALRLAGRQLAELL